MEKTIETDWPYTVQGVAAWTDSSKQGSPAPTDHVFAFVVVEVKARLADRPLPAPDPPVVLKWTNCATPCGTDIMERSLTYLTRPEADEGQVVQNADPDNPQMLSPGVGHITTLAAPIPQAVDLKTVRMCTARSSLQKDQCIPLGPLPSLD
jgi:hypothetical protein